MKAPSDRMLCALRDNTLISFGQYSIRDFDSGVTLMHITEEQQAHADRIARREEDKGLTSIKTRTVMYRFGP